MKTKKIILTLLIGLCLFYSCSERGETIIKLDGSESNLPAELKGLKVYLVSTGNTGYVKAAILNNEINSISYPKNKSTESVIMINNKNKTGKVYQVKDILIENDSIIVARK